MTMTGEGARSGVLSRHGRAQQPDAGNQEVMPAAPRPGDN